MAHCRNCGRKSGKYQFCKNCYRNQSIKSTAYKYANVYGKKAGSYSLKYSKRGAVYAKNQTSTLIANARQRNRQKNLQRAHTVQAIMNSNLPPEKKQQVLNNIKTRNSGFFSRFRKY